MSLSQKHLLVLLALSLSLGACGDASDDDDSAGDDDDAAGDDDDSAGDDDDATGDDDDAADDDDSAGDDDDAPAGSVTVSGDVALGTKPGAGQDLDGDLFIVVLEAHPSTPTASPPIAVTMLLGADFTDPATRVAFELTGIPTRTEPYYLTGFLDADQSGSEAGPTPGDILASPVEFTADTPGSLVIDLALGKVKGA